MGTNVPWPDARTVALRSLFRSGASDSAIAKALGVSKSAVIGKRQRLGLWRQPPRAIDGDAYEMAMRRAQITANNVRISSEIA